MAKVLISFLGTGRLIDKNAEITLSKRRYDNAKYRIDGKDYEKPFVAAVLKEHYSIDKTIFIGTPHSMWEEVYSSYSNNSADANKYVEIAEYCDAANYTSELYVPYQDDIEAAIGNDSKVILIHYGLTEEEIQQNINIILGVEQYIHNQDELIIDVTHSFRSLPLMIMNLLFYLKSVSPKNITINHIHYGMLEATRELGFAPIVDLNETMNVNDWITGAYSFKEFGNAYRIADLIETENKSVAQRLRDFSNVMNVNHLLRIKTESQRLASIKNEQYKTSMPKLILSQVIDDFTSNFKQQDKDSVFQFKLAKWQFKHKNYVSAYLSLFESIVTFACEQANQACADFGTRELMKNRLNEEYKYRYKYEGPKFNDPSKDDALYVHYERIKMCRNTTAHSLENGISVTKMIKILDDSFKILSKVII
jgi:CRISPR-associated Csx2 family protein